MNATATPPPDQMNAAAPAATAPHTPGRIRLFAIGGFFLVAFAGLAALGLRARAVQQTQRDDTVAARPEKPRVLIAKADRAAAFIDQVLPGSAAPQLETAIYARTSGYLKRWLVDIGDSVKEGQLMAEIETPEVDAQLLQARATLNESKATLERNKASEYLARVNLNRFAELIKTNAASQQDYDSADAAQKVAVATIRVTDATITANEAAVRRLDDLQRFQKITAPFSGVVTARNFDPGALIVADTATARELFHISQIATLRVFADVPQMFATSIKDGQKAVVFRREALGREYAGTVTRTTRSVDPRTRTLRVEVDVDNPNGALLPGMYLQVRFRLDTSNEAVRVPGAAIVTRADGTKVAVVDAQGAVHYRSVVVGRDFGTMIEVVSGLKGGESLVVRPGDDLPEGTLVEAVSATSP